MAAKHPATPFAEWWLGIPDTPCFKERIAFNLRTLYETNSAYNSIMQLNRSDRSDGRTCWVTIYLGTTLSSTSIGLDPRCW